MPVLRTLLALALALLPGWPALARADAEPLACDSVVVYVREGCPHCHAAREYLEQAAARLPPLRISYRDVSRDPQARADFETLNRARHLRQPGVPTFVICDEVLVGFDSAASTGSVIEGVLTGRIAALREHLSVELPLLGEVNPAALGLPAFTIALGLIDGFNPCAMWVLLFLLSLLVHIRSRWRIALVAGTFVLVSGLVYFAFMAAWLNVYLIIGYSRALQLALGAIALLVAALHLGEALLPGRTPHIGIPEAVKPSLYQRARGVVRAENLAAAMLAVVVIAVMVNFVELLCTAGLPALYAQVLSYYPLGTAGYYGYLALYNVAYMADDGLMVLVAVVTLGQHKLQERHGRWLKLLSACVIGVMGALLLFAPGWLVF